MKVGDLVRRIDLAENIPHWLSPYVGVIVAEMDPDFRSISCADTLFAVFWGEEHGTFVSTESKLELISENR